MGRATSVYRVRAPYNFVNSTNLIGPAPDEFGGDCFNSFASFRRGPPPQFAYNRAFAGEEFDQDPVPPRGEPAGGLAHRREGMRKWVARLDQSDTCRAGPRVVGGEYLSPSQQPP